MAPRRRSDVLSLNGFTIFFAPKHPFKASAMDDEPEGPLQIGLQIADAPSGALGPPLLDIRKDFRRQLVPLLWPATLRQQFTFSLQSAK